MKYEDFYKLVAVDTRPSNNYFGLTKITCRLELARQVTIDENRAYSQLERNDVRNEATKVAIFNLRTILYGELHNDLIKFTRDLSYQMNIDNEILGKLHVILTTHFKQCGCKSELKNLEEYIPPYQTPAPTQESPPETSKFSFSSDMVGD